MKYIFPKLKQLFQAEFVTHVIRRFLLSTELYKNSFALSFLGLKSQWNT